jgi:hypothetical protein
LHDLEEVATKHESIPLLRLRAYCGSARLTWRQSSWSTFTVSTIVIVVSTSSPNAPHCTVRIYYNLWMANFWNSPEVQAYFFNSQMFEQAFVCIRDTTQPCFTQQRCSNDHQMKHRKDDQGRLVWTRSIETERAEQQMFFR